LKPFRWTNKDLDGKPPFDLLDVPIPGTKEENRFFLVRQGHASGHHKSPPLGSIIS
jgi:hypothetical protein